MIGLIIILLNFNVNSYVIPIKMKKKNNNINWVLLLHNIENPVIKNKQLIYKLLQLIYSFIIYIYIYLKKLIIKEEKRTFIDKFLYKYLPITKFIFGKITLIMSIVSWFTSVTGTFLSIFTFFRYGSIVIGIIESIIEFFFLKNIIMKFIKDIIKRLYHKIDKNVFSFFL